MSSGTKVLRTVKEFRKWHSQHNFHRSESLGFVPTMGALHRGHLSLMEQSARENTKTAASIFINPAQFAPNEDLDKYPKTFEQDLEKIGGLSSSIDVVFCPTVSEMYPSGFTLDPSQQKGAFVAVQGLSHMLEGSIRPHFFRGVATVVCKLLNIVDPDLLYLGRKDYQQHVVVKRMMKDLCMRAKLRIGPTEREPNGLAMSSRNAYLTSAQREIGIVLYETLKDLKERINANKTTNESMLSELLESARTRLGQSDHIQLQYLEITNENLEPIKTMSEIHQCEEATLSGAILVGTTRLIDNISLRE